MGTAQIGTGNISYTHGLYSKFFLTTQLAFRTMNGVLLPGLGCVAQRGLWLYYTGAALQFGAFFWNCGGGSIVGSRRNRQEAGWAGWKGRQGIELQLVEGHYASMYLYFSCGLRPIGAHANSAGRYRVVTALVFMLTCSQLCRLND